MFKKLGATATLAVVLVAGNFVGAPSAEAASGVGPMEFTTTAPDTGIELGHMSRTYHVEFFSAGSEAPYFQQNVEWGVSTRIAVGSLVPGSTVVCAVPSLPRDQPYDTSCLGGGDDPLSATPITLGPDPSSLAIDLTVRAGYQGPQLVDTGAYDGFVDSADHGYPPLGRYQRPGDGLHVNFVGWASAAGDESGVHESLQWTRDGKPISHATGRIYRLTHGDVGHRIAVEVIGSRAGRADSDVVRSDAIVVSGSTLVRTRAATVHIDRISEADYRFSVAAPPRYSASGVLTEYEWLVDGKLVGRGTSMRTSRHGAVELRTTASRAGGYEDLVSLIPVRESIAPPQLWRAASHGPGHSLRTGTVATVDSAWLYGAQNYSIEHPDDVTYTWQYAREGRWVTFASDRVDNGTANHSSERMPAAAAGHTVRVIVRAFSSRTVHGMAILLGGRVGA